MRASSGPPPWKSRRLHRRDGRQSQMDAKSDDGVTDDDEEVLLLVRSNERGGRDDPRVLCDGRARDS